MLLPLARLRKRGPWGYRGPLIRWGGGEGRIHEASRKRGRAEEREAKWAARKIRWSDAIGGAPSPEA